MPAFEAEVGLPYWLTLHTRDAAASARFYSEVVGWDIPAPERTAEEEAASWIAHTQGLPVAEIVPYPAETGYTPQDMWVPHFLSADVAGDCARVEELGGASLGGEPGAASAFLRDPVGGFFAVAGRNQARFYMAAGEAQTPMWYELGIPREFVRTVKFYADLFNWEVRFVPSPEGGPAGEPSYAFAEVNGAGFLGFWNARGVLTEQDSSVWNISLGVRDLEQAVRRAQELGARALTGVEQADFGRVCMLADATGALFSLCEAPELRESGDCLHDGFGFPEGSFPNPPSGGGQ